MSSAEHFCFLLIEEFSHIAFACAVEPLRIANLVSGEELYKWSFASKDGERATCSNGSVTLVHHGLHALPRCDRLFVLSGIHMRDHITPELMGVLRKEARHGTQIDALCSGAWIVASAGLLDGMKAAIHWEYHDSFSEEFLNVHLVRNVFVSDEKRLTASGGTATADLMLHLIETTHGIDLATAVADQMVYTSVRAATAQQKVSIQSRSGVRNAHLTAAIKRMRETIEAPLSAAELADEIGISTRQLERLFGRYLNTSPKRYFMELRLEKARNLLVQSEASVLEIALACGFESSGHFARVYRNAYGVTPMEQRTKLT